MKIFRLREKLSKEGFILIQKSHGFIVTNNGTLKELFEKEFENLDAVEAWFSQRHSNRLNDEEAEKWDKDWEEFVEAQ
jgi:hypothetical protein